MDNTSSQQSTGKVTPPIQAQPVSGSRCLAEEYFSEYIESTTDNVNTYHTLSQKVGYSYSGVQDTKPVSVKVLDADWTPPFPYKEYTKTQLEAYIAILQKVYNKL